MPVPESFWLPNCMGGAVAGDSSGCTCWPETDKQRAKRKAYERKLEREREARELAEHQQRVRAFNDMPLERRAFAASRPLRVIGAPPSDRAPGA